MCSIVVDGLYELEAWIIKRWSGFLENSYIIFREKDQNLVQRFYGKKSIQSLICSLSYSFSISKQQRDCPNGELTRDSFIQIYKQFFPKGRAENFCEHVFRAFDTGKKGNALCFVFIFVDQFR